jgi:DNA-binding response OmpR family regulator
MKKVLVIDDSIMIRKMVKGILTEKYEVLEANDGKSGLEAARQSHPDLILLDFVMPKYNGYQTLQAIRRIDALRETPVIMISGLKEQVTEHVPEPFTEFDFLEKPFEAEVLIARIQNLLLASAATAATATEAPIALPRTAEVAPLAGGGDVQTLMARLTSLETLLVQGIENLIQREVVARIGQQESELQALNQRVDRLVQQIEHQNKGLMVVLKEIKSLKG